MRLNLEVSRSETGQFEGTVETGPDSCVSFSGTLELLKVLEDATDKRRDEDPS